MSHDDAPEPNRSDAVALIHSHCLWRTARTPPRAYTCCRARRRRFRTAQMQPHLHITARALFFQLCFLFKVINPLVEHRIAHARTDNLSTFSVCVCAHTRWRENKKNQRMNSGCGARVHGLMMNNARTRVPGKCAHARRFVHLAM